MAWLIVGLGNPGTQYEFTLHNLGFLVVDRLAVRNAIKVNRQDSKAIVGVGMVSGRAAILAKPQTFMNLSGTSVKALCDKHEVLPQELLVVYDDSDLSWTGVRIRPKGSAGGHHGLESVIKSLGTQDFARLRLGIHPGHPVRHGAEFVLSSIKKAQMQDLDELLDHTAAAVESIIAEGVEMSMTRFNRRARGLNKEEE